MVRYDYVVFGATGFTGEFVVEELAQTIGDGTFAVAGRNDKKLLDVLTATGQRLGKDFSHIPRIVADVSDEPSLVAMAKVAKVVLNVVGPYRFYGEAVVKACVENGAHHVDISGEPIYLEKMQLNYNDKAKENGVYIVGACGFDSIPIEMGMRYLRQHMPGDVNSVETFAEMKDGPQGSTINFGTFHSMIYGVAHAKELKPIRRALFPQRLPKSPYPPPKRGSVFYQDALEGWCIPFMGSDKSVVNRTQMYDYLERKERPMTLNTFMRVGSLPKTIALVVWGIFFFIMAQFQFGRKMLEQYPEVFTFGKFSKTGPSREQLKGCGFSYWFFGKGWKDTMADSAQQHEEPPDTEVVARVDGPDAAYIGTAAMMVTCARTLMDEPNNLPAGGGVFPPGALFEKTDLINRLEQRGIKFTLVSPPTAINS
jgi:short subunit dehydrogenase-like uncharacterized protein